MDFFFKKKKLLKPYPCDPKVRLFWQQLNYDRFYGFSKDPFDPQPDPRRIFLTDNVREVWNSILSGIDQRKGFLFLTGEKGMGKTTLISLICLYLSTNGRRVKVIRSLIPHKRSKRFWGRCCGVWDIRQKGREKAPCSAG